MSHVLMFADTLLGSAAAHLGRNPPLLLHHQRADKYIMTCVHEIDKEATLFVIRMLILLAGTVHDSVS